MRIRMLMKFEIRHVEAFSEILGITVEAINSIQLVASYSLEHPLQGPIKEVLRGSGYAWGNSREKRVLPHQHQPPGD
jgi:hypothetical protein